MNQLDNGLGTRITGRCLGGKQKGGGRKFCNLPLLNLKGQCQNTQTMQQLALILVQALDLHIQHTRRVIMQPLTLHPAGQAAFIFFLGFTKGRQHLAIVRIGL